jgi:hypothetical protein
VIHFFAPELSESPHWPMKSLTQPSFQAPERHQEPFLLPGEFPPLEQRFRPADIATELWVKAHQETFAIASRET